MALPGSHWKSKKLRKIGPGPGPAPNPGPMGPWMEDEGPWAQGPWALYLGVPQSLGPLYPWYPLYTYFLSGVTPIHEQ